MLFLNQHSTKALYPLAGSEPTKRSAEPTQNRPCWFSKTQYWRGLAGSELTEPTEPTLFALYIQNY
nr:MAG TPA: hypothetical protein [Caudoviricetes sp.]